MSTDDICPICKGAKTQTVPHRITDNKNIIYHTVACYACGGTGKKSDLLYK